jgi:hypothetical protein
MVAVERELAAQKEQELKPQIGPFGLHLHAYQPIRKLVIDGKPVFDIQGWGDPERPWGLE